MNAMDLIQSAPFEQGSTVFLYRRLNNSMALREETKNKQPGWRSGGSPGRVNTPALSWLIHALAAGSHVLAITSASCGGVSHKKKIKMLNGQLNKGECTRTRRHQSARDRGDTVHS